MTQMETFPAPSLTFGSYMHHIETFILRRDEGIVKFDTNTITTQIQIEAGQTKGKGEGFWCEGLSDGKYRLSRRPLILIVWPPEVECSTKP